MAELLEIKRRRAQVAVKMDDVRREHELANKSSEVCLFTSPFNQFMLTL
jgi:hypothetical protein